VQSYPRKLTHEKTFANYFRVVDGWLGAVGDDACPVDPVASRRTQ